MIKHSLSRLTAAADLLRPKTFFRTLSRVDALADRTRQLTEQVAELREQNEQLITIQRLDWEMRDEFASLSEALDAKRIGAHVRRAIESATLEMDPFPHVVVENWLPTDIYKHLIAAIPPPVFFTDRENGRHRVSVPFTFGPAYSRMVWDFMYRTLVARILNRALNAKFQDAVRDYVRSACPALPGDADIRLHASDGRIMLRHRGYNLLPHRDPRWGFMTVLIYLAREGDAEAYGTRLYRVRDDAGAPDSRVYYIDPERCDLVKTVPFRANSMLVFLNSTGAHAASIPEDAPADVERYFYQFRLGPSPAVLRQMLSLMTPEQATLWAGAKADRAGG